MGDHVPLLKSLYERLLSMGSELDETMTVAIMIATLGEYNEFDPTITLVNKMKEQDAEWMHL